MSAISPGSRATTSLFMVVTLLTLAALIWRGSQEDAVVDACMERLVSMNALATIAPDGQAQPVTVAFNLLADGSVTEPTVLSPTDSRDAQILDSLNTAVFSPGEPASCVFYFSAES